MPPSDDYKHLSKEDRAGIAEAQLRQFEGDRFAHELNIERLDKIPEKNRDENWGPARDAAEQAIETIKLAESINEKVAKELGG